MGNIRQRVLALGGVIEIDSAPGQGTSLRASIPLVEPQTAGAAPVDTYRPDHTLNSVFLLGIGGGLALMAVLFYPLYLLVPAGLVEGWPAGSRAIGLVLQLAAALMAVALGSLAARWTGAGTRQEGTLWGALAGGVAGAICYLGLAGAAAIVAGGGVFLAQGPVQVAGDAEAMILLSGALNSAIWAAYGTFWIALLAGMGLGALGGLIAPPIGSSSDRSNLRPAMIPILVAAALLSALSLGAAVSFFPQIELTLRYLISGYEGALAGTLPLVGVSLWPIVTQGLLYLGSLLALYPLLRGEARVEDRARVASAQIQVAGMALLALGMPVVTWLLGREALALSPLLRALVSLAAAGSLVLAGLYGRLFAGTCRQRGIPALDRVSILRAGTIVAMILSLAALAWSAALPSLLTVLIALGLISASAALVAVLWRQPKAPPSEMNGWARLQLSMSQAIGAGLGTIVAMVIPLMPLLSVTLGAATILVRFPRLLVRAGAGGWLEVPGHSPADLVQNIYLAQASGLLFSLVGAGAIVGLLMLVIGGRMALGRRR